MNEIELLTKEYYNWLDQQSFTEKELDYSALEKYKPMLKQLSLLSNCGVSVFDLYRKEYIEATYNFNILFGYDLADNEKSGADYFTTRIHPDDFLQSIRTVIEATKFLFELPKEERSFYKLITEYRVLNGNEKYAQILEQYQVLELDKNGQIWLAMSTTDVLPGQEEAGFNSQLLNYKTGNYFPLENGKTHIIKKEAFLDKETGSDLSAHMEKVNIQRKKILEKLHPDNPSEAVKRFVKFGLVN